MSRLRVSARCGGRGSHELVHTLESFSAACMLRLACVCDDQRCDGSLKIPFRQSCSSTNKAPALSAKAFSVNAPPHGEPQAPSKTFHSTLTLLSLHNFIKQEQQRVAVGPGNAHCMSIYQLSLRAALASSVLWPAAAAAPDVRLL